MQKSHARHTPIYTHAAQVLMHSFIHSHPWKLYKETLTLTLRLDYFGKILRNMIRNITNYAN